MYGVAVKHIEMLSARLLVAAIAGLISLAVIPVNAHAQADRQECRMSPTTGDMICTGEGGMLDPNHSLNATGTNAPVTNRTQQIPVNRIGQSISGSDCITTQNTRQEAVVVNGQPLLDANGAPEVRELVYYTTVCAGDLITDIHSGQANQLAENVAILADAISGLSNLLGTLDSETHSQIAAALSGIFGGGNVQDVLLDVLRIVGGGLPVGGEEAQALQQVTQQVQGGNTTPFTNATGGGGPVDSSGWTEAESIAARCIARIDDATAGQCGKGVANILEALGYPHTRGDGHDWHASLPANGWTQLPVQPNDCPPGGVLTFNSDVRQGKAARNGGGGRYGHVEIVTSVNGDRAYTSDATRSNWGGTVPDNYQGCWVYEGETTPTGSYRGGNVSQCL